MDECQTAKSLVNSIGAFGFACYARRPSTEGEIAFGLLGRSITVVEGVGDYTCEFARRRDGSGGARIILRDSLAAWVKRQCIIAAAFRLWQPEVCALDPDAPIIAALCERLNARDLRLFGEDLVEATVSDLYAHPALWGRRSPRDLVSAAVEIVRALQRQRATASYRRARKARDSASYRIAALWFGRVLRASRVGEDRWLEGKALVGLGKTFELMGDYPAARRALRRAARHARLHGLRLIRAWALHDLACLSIEERAGGVVERLARAAFRAYPANSPHRAVLAKDIAGHWVLRGDFRRASIVLSAIQPHMPDDTERLFCCALLARAAGADGDHDAYEAAAKTTGELIGRCAAPWALAQAHLNLGWGSFSAGQRDAALHHAAEACRRADEEGATRLASAARDLLEVADQRGRLEWIRRPANLDADAFAEEVVCFFRGERPAAPLALALQA